MKNHAVCIPLPAQGHIRPMLKLAQLLHFKFDFHITFINTHHNHQTLFKTHQNNNYYYSDSNLENQTSTTTPTFKFESLPKQGFEDSKDPLSLLNAILEGHLGPPLKELLLKLGSKDYYKCLPKGDSRPPVTCMISDVGMSVFTLDVAEEIGIPAVALQTSGGCGMMGYLLHRQLLDKGIIPLKDSSCLTNGYLDMVIDWIPSLKGICLKDMPTSIRTTDPNDKMMNHVMSAEYRALNSQATIINTFESMEPNVLKELSSFSPNIYPIGPLNLLADQILEDVTSSPIIIGNASSFKEDVDYIQWLDSQEPNSVLYVNFGTLVVLNQDQIVELAWGLANSEQKFFWVLRSDDVIGGSNSNLLPLGFEELIKERGILVSWCDQERVLRHPSIRGFVTHCGWNSVIESISNGVPMICWPIFAEQGTNSWFCCNYLGIGVNVSEAPKRDDVERVIKELIDGEKGKEMKRKVTELRRLAKEATRSPHGSSYVNLESLVNEVLLSTCSN